MATPVPRQIVSDKNHVPPPSTAAVFDRIVASRSQIRRAFGNFLDNRDTVDSSASTRIRRSNNQLSKLPSKPSRACSYRSPAVRNISATAASTFSSPYLRQFSASSTFPATVYIYDYVSVSAPARSDFLPFYYDNRNATSTCVRKRNKRGRGFFVLCFIVLRDPN